MIEYNIPGREPLKLEHLVCNVNGTLTLDGSLIDGVAWAIAQIREQLQVHLVTGNTYQRQMVIDQQLHLKGVCVQAGNETEQKAAFVRQLGAEKVAAIGQGVNDAEMLRIAALGIAVMSNEGLAAPTLMAADLVVPDILAAFALFEKPMRIVATLRR